MFAFNLARLLGLRRGELARAVPMAGLYALVLATIYMAKPARNALFLERFGAAQLPWALMLVAVIGAVGALFVPADSLTLHPRRSVRVLFPVFAGGFALFWSVLDSGSAEVVYAFYVWVNLFGLVATSLIWLLANVVFDAREARRAFGFIGAGGIAGAIAGGLATERLVHVIGTRDLLLVSAFGLLACALLAELPEIARDPPARRRRRRGERPEPEGLRELIASSPLLAAVMAMTGIAAMVSALVDVQFNVAVGATFAATDEKAAFFGRFFAILNAAALFFQLLITPRFLKRVGVGAALLVLPAALALGSLGALLMSGLIAAVIPKAADLGLRHSLHRAASEVLFLPIPSAAKQRTKVLVDSTLDNLGTGLGAAIALGLTLIAPARPGAIAAAVLAMAAVWLLVASWSQRAYVAEFRQALTRREVDPESVRVELSDPTSIDALLTALEGDNERQLVYALRMLATVQSPAIMEPTLRLLEHRSSEIRALALRALEHQSRTIPPDTLERLLRDSDAEVQRQAMAYACAREGGGAERLRPYLESPEPRIQAAALACLADRVRSADRALLTPELADRIIQQPGDDSALARRSLARLIGASRDPKLVEHAARLRGDPVPEVVEAAIEAAGLARDTELAPWLVSCLGARRLRAAARDALVRLGSAAVAPLSQSFGSSSAPLTLRHHAARVLGRIAVQESVDVCVGLLAGSPPLLRTRLLKSLNRLRTGARRLRFDAARITPLLAGEVAWCGTLTDVRRRGAAPDGPAGRLLWRAIEEKQQESLERVFRLLALLHSPGDVRAAYVGVVHGGRTLRASALEFLENVLAHETKRQVMPLLDRIGAVEPPREGPRSTSGGAWLRELIASSDDWLRACTVFVMDPSGSVQVRALLERACDDPAEVVREAARRVLGRSEALPC